MKSTLYDLVVLGGGAGGLTVAAGAAGLGAKVALIEQSELLGGDCLHYGCVPSKAFIAAAKRAHEVREVEIIAGIEERDTNRDNILFKHALKCVREAINHIQAHDHIDRFRELGVDVIQGFGRFKNVVEIETNRGNVVRGKRFVVATGSRPALPSIPGLNQAGFLTNESVFSLSYRPTSLAVIGGGPIGLELAQAFARFGIEVTILEAGNVLLQKEDTDIAEIAFEALKGKLNILHNSNILEVNVNSDGTKSITIEVVDKKCVLIVDDILVAAGRHPNTDNIGIEQIGVKMNGKHITVDATMRTNIKNIFAVGDVVQAFPFTHAAALEAKVVVSNALFGLRRKVDYLNMPWVTFMDPEVFHLGFTEKEARSRFDNRVRIYSTNLDDVDRFVADRRMRGMVKLITDRRGRILGAHAIGSGASDWMQEVVYAKTFRKKIGTLSIPVYPYPVRAAAIQQAADQYWRKKLFDGFLQKVLQWYIRWFR